MSVSFIFVNTLAACSECGGCLKEIKMAVRLQPDGHLYFFFTFTNEMLGVISFVTIVIAAAAASCHMVYYFGVRRLILKRFSVYKNELSAQFTI